jgi:aminobenzoyl-glutamate utilization protein B
MGAGASAKGHALDWLDGQRQRFSDFHQEIWRYAEPAWREYRSAQAYVELLRGAGFAVEEGSGGMPTAFRATWGEGRPVLGSYAEYDAVPGNSQQAVPYRAPREGLHPWAAGHTDPHSMLGVATLSGVLAAKAAMERYRLRGTLVYLGEPAEKVCGSKPVHAAKGYYDGVDAFIAYHPWPLNTVPWETHFGAYWSAVFTFECLTPETWIDRTLMPVGSGSHGVARCPGALDALCLMYTMTKYTKESMFPHTGTWTLNEHVLAAGDATADNLPPKFSQIQYAWRSPDLRIQEQIFRVLTQNARQAAATTGCRASLQWVTKTRVGLPNLALAELTYGNLEAVGAPRWGEEALAFGRQIQATLGYALTEFPFLPQHRALTSPHEFEAQHRAILPPWQMHLSADDYVEYCWHAPTVRLLTARPTLQPGDPRHAAPAWTYNALGGYAPAIDPGMFVAGKTIAATLVDLLAQPEALARCQAEFVDRTGGGVGGRHWVAPLLPADFRPPVDLPWPAYVTTARGEEWWLPTPAPGASEPL